MKKAVAEKLEKFFITSNLTKYKKGDLILRGGDPVFGIFYLKEGLVRQYLVSEAGEEITIHIFRPTSFFPIMLVITEVENPFYFEAVGEVITYRQDPSKVLAFVKENPDVLFDLTVRFSQAILGLTKRIESLTVGSAYTKVVSLLIYLADKFGKESSDGVEISLPITHQDVASWVGINRETTSRQIEELIGKGLIYQDKHLFVIKDKTKLSFELSS